MPLDPNSIAKTLGCAPENVTANWPLIQDELAEHGFASLNQQIAALATIGVECPSFAPVVERGGRDYYIRMYWLNAVTAKSLGNTSADDAANYCGRGFIQITGRWNYQHYGTLINIDLINHPDLALDPANSAKIFACYWKDKKCDRFAEQASWVDVRKAVNGPKANGLPEFLKFVNALQAVQ